MLVVTVWYAYYGILQLFGNSGSMSYGRVESFGSLFCQQLSCNDVGFYGIYDDSQSTVKDGGYLDYQRAIYFIIILLSSCEQ